MFRVRRRKTGRSEDRKGVQKQQGSKLRGLILRIQDWTFLRSELFAQILQTVHNNPARLAQAASTTFHPAIDRSMLCATLAVRNYIASSPAASN